MAGCDKRVSFVLLLSAFHYLLLGVSAVTYDVSASGGGLDLSEAMSLAEAGDTVSLADGTYDAAIVSHRDGKNGSPITIVGGPGAVIKGDFSSRSVLIKHSFITLKGFSVQGKVGSSSAQEAYVNKCVYVEGSGTDSSSPLDGFVMEGLSIENCGGECVRLKDFVVNAVIEGNDIKNCGIHDYQFHSGDKNGEGVYIGTSSNLWINGPDACDNNLVKGNQISTSGNECVDIKEGATGNVIEDNVCSNQLDANSGCYDSRGDGNVFRYNVGSDCLGAGVRLGGWEINGHQYGVGNSVYGNDFSSVGNGALKVLVSGQRDICGNTCGDGSCALKGENLSGITDTWNRACGDVGGPSTSSFTAPSPPSTSTSATFPSPRSSSSSSGTTGDGSASDETSDSGATSFATPQSDGGGEEDDGGSDDNDDDAVADEPEEEETEPEEEQTEPEEEAGDEDDDSAEAEETDEEEEEDIDEEKEREKEEEVEEEERREEEKQQEEEEEEEVVVEETEEEKRREEEEEKKEKEEKEPLKEHEEDEDTPADDRDGNDGGDDTEPITTSDSDDYGNDYGDDFDSDDNSHDTEADADSDKDDQEEDTVPITSDSDDYGNDHGDDFDADDESQRRGRRLLRGGGGGRN